MSYGASTANLKEATANTVQGSQENAKVAPAPQAFLRLDTGEVIGVPAGDVTKLNNEFDKWNRLIYEQILANEVLSICDERLARIAQEEAIRPRGVGQKTVEEARKAQGFALQWREEATEKLRAELKPLDKLGGAGKKLIELIPLVEKENDSPAKYERGKDDGQWKRDGTDLKKAWSFKSAAGIRDQFMQKERYRGVGPIRVLSSDTLKTDWPKFKDTKTIQWADVYKADKDGKRKIDRARLRNYLGEQVQGLKAKSSDFVRLEVSSNGTLGPEVLANWNANATVSKEAELIFGQTQIGDIDLGAEAAAMRYFTGGSLSGEIAPLKGNVRVKAEGSAEVAFAEGKAAASLYLPSKEGVLLYLFDLEQVSALSQGKNMPGKPYDLGAVRFVAAAELKGVIGVSMAGEVSLGVEMKDVESPDVDGTTKRRKTPYVNGSRRKAKRASAIDIGGQGNEWKNTAGLAAEVSFFAGAKGGLALKGGLQWRNPHNEKKDFEIMASIAPEALGQAGIGGAAKLNIDYVDGIFRITAHAGLCFGVGAEGTVTLGVGAKQLASFFYWLYYNLLHVGFRTFVYMTKNAFSAFKHLTFLLVSESRKVGEYFEIALDDLEKNYADLQKKYAKAEASYQLGRQVLANPEEVRFSPPETKGMLIYQLTRHGKASLLVEPGLGSAYLRTQKQAVLSILHQTQLKADIKNVIQHIHATGVKGDFTANLRMLKDFFAVEGPGGLDLPGRTTQESDFERIMRQAGFKAQQISDARTSLSGELDQLAMNGDFVGWYEQMTVALKEGPTRGYVAVANNTTAYAMQRDTGDDHPLYAATGSGFYERTA